MPKPKEKKPPRPRRKAGGALVERRSIRLTRHLDGEIVALAKQTYRKFPAVVRLLLQIGLQHRKELAAYQGPGANDMIARRSIRLPDDLAAEIDEMAASTYRTLPMMVCLLLQIGLQHRQDMAKY